MARIDWDKMREPFVELRVDGLALPYSLSSLIATVTVKESRGEADIATVVFNDQMYLVSDCNIFLPGREIGVLIGYREEWRGYTFFVNQEPQLSGGADGQVGFTVNLIDGVFALSQDSVVHNYDFSRLSDVIKAIAERNGLGYNVDELAAFADEDVSVSQIGTDRQFLNRLAASYGYIWKIVGTTLRFERESAIPQTTGEEYELCYRCGDFSIKSWRLSRAPTSRQKRRRRKTGTKKKTGSIDFLVGTVFTAESDPERPETLDANAAGGFLEMLDDSEASAAAIAMYSVEILAAKLAPTVDRSQIPEDVRVFLDQLLPRNTIRRSPEHGTSTPESPPRFAGRAAPESRAKAQVAVGVAASIDTSDVEGSVQFHYATNKLHAGDMLHLYGLGNRFSGPYIIQEIDLRYQQGSSDVLAMSCAVSRKGMWSKVARGWGKAHPGGIPSENLHIKDSDLNRTDEVGDPAAPQSKVKK